MAATRRFRIGEKAYVMPSLDEISLKDLIRFNTEAANLGIAERWADVIAASREMSTMTPDEQDRHELAPVVFGASIWLARRGAGEEISLADAVDVPLSQIVFLPDPEDHRPGKPKGASTKKAPRPRKASAPAAAVEEPSEG